MPEKKNQYLIVDLTDADFKKVVLAGKKAFVVQIQADWCGECFIMTSILQQLAQEFSGRVAFACINVDSNEDMIKQYGVTDLPFILFFNHGELVDHLIGLQSRKKLTRRIEKMMDKPGPLSTEHHFGSKIL